jgi:hypothetical protein
MIDQAGWGSSKIYADGTLRGGWNPKYIIIHWGGLTSERDTLDKEKATLRGWQNYHLGKGWQDIAYNYAIGESGNIYRLRGENHGGHTSGIDPATGLSWSTVGVGIVWIGGQRDEDGPSAAARQTMASYIAERNLPVLGHVQTGKATACPGPDWLKFIEDFNNGGIEPPTTEPPIIEPPSEEHMLIKKGHPVGATVEKIQQGLMDDNPEALPRFGVDGDFGSETELWVRRFQEFHGLPATGWVDDETAWLLS